jgi:hypothetical protein
MGSCSDKDRGGDSHHSGSTAPKTISSTTTTTTHHVEVHRAERPTQQDIKNSVCLFVSTDLVFGCHEMPHIKDFHSFRAHTKTGAFKPWSTIHGLRNKVFWLDEDEKTTGGFYTFFTRRHLEDYMKSDLFASMHKVPFLKNVKYEIHENLAGGELCADMGTWNHSLGLGSVKENNLEDCWMLVPRFKIKKSVLPNKSLDDFRGMLAGGATESWSKIDGLRNKYFTIFDEKWGAGFYSWTSKHAMEKYMKSEIWEGMSHQPHLKNLSYKIYEILEGGACCTDLGEWPRAEKSLLGDATAMFNKYGKEAEKAYDKTAKHATAAWDKTEHHMTETGKYMGDKYDKTEKYVTVTYDSTKKDLGHGYDKAGYEISHGAKGAYKAGEEACKDGYEITTKEYTKAHDAFEKDYKHHYDKSSPKKDVHVEVHTTKTTTYEVSHGSPKTTTYESHHETKYSPKKY